MTQIPDLSRLSRDDKDALILALWAQVQALTARVAELSAPPKTPGNSSIPPSQGKKPNRDKTTRSGPRRGSLGRIGGGRVLATDPNERVTARPTRCAHCQAAFGEADHVMHGRYGKVDLFAALRSVISTAKRAGIDAYQAIKATLRGQSVCTPG